MPTEESLKLHPLTPTDNAKGVEGALEALQFAFGGEKLLNIALSGDYGTGKSSVIETFKKHRFKPACFGRKKQFKFIHLSFAPFRETIVSENSPQISTKETTAKVWGTGGSETNKEIFVHSKNGPEIKEHEIEAKILNQLLHSVPAHKIPRTVFPIKRKWSPVQCVTTLLLLCLGFLTLKYKTGYDLPGNFQGMLQKLPSAMRFGLNPATLHYYIRMLVYAVFVLLCAFILYSVIRFFFRVGGPKRFGISTKYVNAEFLDGDNADLPLFDKYLTEILYILKKIKADAIVIEDLDRTVERKIFEQLRGICHLANLTRKPGKKLRFIYLLKDATFLPEERAKFYDLIIPVRPVLDSRTRRFSALFKLAISAGFYTDINI
jgi:hypothetical protein